MAGGRAVRQIGIRAWASQKVVVSAVVSLVLVAAAAAVLFSNSGSGRTSGRVLRLKGLPYVRRTFLALKSNPLRARVDLMRKQAGEHVALVKAYSSYARKLKLENSRLLRTFEEQSSNFSTLLSRFGPDEDAEGDEALRLLEKEVKERVKLARLLVSESKEAFDTNLKIQKLRDTIFAVNEQLHRAKVLGTRSSAIAAGSTPKSLHCLAMRLAEERVSNPKPYVDYYRHYSNDHQHRHHDVRLYHFAIFSDNVIAVSVVLNSAVKNAADPSKYVFHVVTDAMYLPAFQVWFKKRPLPAGATLEISATADFRFLNSSHAPVVRLIQRGRTNLNLLHHLKFYLPEIFPGLSRIVYLEDDVVVQSDLSGLWNLDLQGRVNGAVEMCFGPFQRYARYLNFSSPSLTGKFSPKACAWSFGLNVFDLDAWRRDKCTDHYHNYLTLNEDGTLWDLRKTLPVGLLTFYANTKPLEKMWHLTGLGYNPSVSADQITNAAVIHFNGKMKPWLDIAMNHYKNLWMKYVDSDMEYLQLCNFGV